MSSKISLEIAEDHAYVAMVRQLGRTLLAHHNTADQDIDDIEAVIGELCANVTRHAQSEAKCFQVMLEHHGDHIVLIVADRGPGFDPDNVPPIGATRTDEDGTIRHGGFGLHLVRRLMDRLEFSHSHPCGTTVRAERRLRGFTEPAPAICL